MRFSVGIIPTLCLCTLMPLLAEDSPQWRGPDRDGISEEKGLLQKWPKDGPPLAWTYEDAGWGFSSVSVVGDRLYTMSAYKGKEYVIALDIKGAKPVEAWRTEVGPIYENAKNFWGDGPRSTPTVDGDHVYALGGMGNLVCLKVKDGKEVWKKDLNKDLGGEMMTYWGNSESVLIDGDAVICTPGGPKGTVAALDKKSGKEIWRSTELKDKATYASIMPGEIGGVKQYVVLGYIDNASGGTVAGVAAKDGALLWRQQYFINSSFAVCTTPLIKGDEVYVTAGYGVGCKLLKLTNDGGKFTVAEKFKDSKVKKLMKNGHGGVVRIDGHIYGHSEKSRWVCQDWKTGKAAWDDNEKLPCESGSITAADGHLYLYSDEGECVLLKADPEKWDEQGRFTIPKRSDTQQKTNGGQFAKVWAHPVIANGKLFLRDQEYLFCYDIRGKK